MMIKINSVGINQSDIQNGFIEKIVDIKEGGAKYMLLKPVGFSPIIGCANNLIGWEVKNNTEVYIDFKRESIASMLIPHLKVLAKYQEKDVHFVFDALEYIDHCKSFQPEEVPIVVVFLYTSDVGLIENELGYPVIDYSEFNI